MTRAARGFVLVFVGALLFFGFVIGSGLLGAIGQAALAFAFSCGLLVWLGLRMGHDQRQRVALEVRRFVRPSSRG